MIAGKLLCKIGKGKNLCDDNQAVTLLETIRLIASVGDEEAFSVLPPLLMNDHHAPSLQLPWGAEAKNLDNVYTKGPIPHSSRGSLIGCAMMDVAGSDQPVLLFVNNDYRTITCLVYNCKFSLLESQFYKCKVKPSEIEIKWKGVELSMSHNSIFEMADEFFRCIGIKNLPEFMLSNSPTSHHLKRTGPIPFLHLRTASNEHEVFIMQTLVQRYFSYQLKHGGSVDTDFDMSLFKSSKCEYKFQTLFSKENLVSVEDLDNVMYEKSSLLSQSNTLCAIMGHMLQCEYADDIDLSFISKSPQKPSESAESAAFATISNLMESTCNLYSAHRINVSGNTHSQVHAISKSLFASAHAEIATREFISGGASLQRKATLSGRLLVRDLAKLMDDSTSVMCIDTNSNREIKSIRLVNSTSDYELDIDCAGRLLGCPWVLPIAIVQVEKSSAHFFMLSCTGLHREQGKACSFVTERAENQSTIGKRVQECEDVISTLLGNVTSIADSADVDKLKSAKRRWSESRQVNVDDHDVAKKNKGNANE